jgi:hypothetical protein
MGDSRRGIYNTINTEGKNNLYERKATAIQKENSMSHHTKT